MGASCQTCQTDSWSRSLREVKGQRKDKGKDKGNDKGSGKGKDKSTSEPRPADLPTKGKGRGRGRGTGKGKPEEDTSPKPDPKGPNVVPETWRNKVYDDIPIVQDARPSEDHVAAYVQGTADVPTFRVVWVTSVGTTKREVQVSPSKFKDPLLWNTPDESPEFWKPCHDGNQYVTLTPGDDDCCRMCPDTDADELLPCAWCNSWAHYRCTCAVGPGRACASHCKVVNPLDKMVVGRDDDPTVPTTTK